MNNFFSNTNKQKGIHTFLQADYFDICQNIKALNTSITTAENEDLINFIMASLTDEKVSEDCDKLLYDYLKHGDLSAEDNLKLRNLYILINCIYGHNV